VRVLHFIAVAALACALVPARAEKRVALVIGNDRYANLTTNEQLHKAVNDARAIGAALTRLRFEVMSAENVDRSALVDKLDAFTQRLAPGDTAFFFFSGHGVTLGGVNYILPSDVPDIGENQESRLSHAALSEQEIVTDLKARGVGVAVVVLDACRTNPFRRSGGKGVGGEKGLMPPQQVKGVFSLYAASSGQAARDRLSDDDRNPNSVFSRVLAPVLTRPGIDLATLAIEVREEVAQIAAAAGYVQQPAYYDETTGGRVYLNGALPPGERQANAASPDAERAERAWSAIQYTTNVTVLDEYIRLYGNVPVYGPLARARREEVGEQGRNQAAQSFAPLVKKATASVVAVYAARVAGNQEATFADPVFRKFFGSGGEQVQRSVALGVIVDPTGLVVTTHHLIENADQVKVSLIDRREFEADIILKDKYADLAVLRLRNVHEPLAVIELGDSDALQAGDAVMALGNPSTGGQTVTRGIVSKVARTQVGTSDYQFLIQSDAATSPGDSGGALVDLGGRLVGINKAFSRSGDSHGVSAAIPVNMVKGVISAAQGGSPVMRRPWLGAKLQPVTPEIADSLNLKRPAGALVASVAPRGPAARAGMRAGDLVVSVDGQDVDDVDVFDYRLSTKAVGGEAIIAVMRGGREVKLTVPLETLPDAPREEAAIKTRSPFIGAKIANLSPALAEEMRLEVDPKGVVVIGVESGSTAESFGLQKGDIVLVVNNVRIETTRDLVNVTGKPSKMWRITIQRGGQQISATFNG
jgi:Do/DeqQ family serine protease